MAIKNEKEKKKKVPDEVFFLWEGKDRTGRLLGGEMRGASVDIVKASLKKQGYVPTKVKKKGGNSKPVSESDVALFTRQLSTMMTSGIPLLQSFEIVGRGSDNINVAKLLLDMKNDIESGTSLSGAFKGHPLLFDALFVNLIEAGEAAGILDTLLDRLATYKEKTIAIKRRVKSALFYPAAIMVVAFVVTAIIMIFVIPSFKEMFESFGAALPTPTLIMMAISDFFVTWWWAIFGGIGGSLYTFFYNWKRRVGLQKFMDRILLQAPIFGPILKKSAIARWSRTLATMFAAGVSLIEALPSVAGAAGNTVYEEATYLIIKDINSGLSISASMQRALVFPSMVLQMVAIGEESGALDSMLSKVADFYEDEVDVAVDSLSSLMEPIIMVVLGVLIGSMVISMYLPIFKMGTTV